ncbi:DnaA N-terminal domain-containing protein [Fodinicurvata sp. EGI_FJ10296]|uniref:DnaA N-terminal domain-containing protein n=1 Tax=Fodinicurvata sp. EGI_FJ10296 TaxID=3231908 RepID=UPI003453D1E3
MTASVPADDFPDPLLPPEIDLTRLPSMMVNIREIKRSPMMLKVPDRALRAAMALLWSAWEQIPAGTLPTDDAELANLADLGAGPRATTRWLRIKNEALRGWTLCSDGRYHNAMIARWALDAWARIGGEVPGQPGKQRTRAPAATKEAERQRRYRARKIAEKAAEESTAKAPADVGCDAGDARNGGVTSVTVGSVTRNVTSPLKGKENRKTSPQSPPAGGGGEMIDSGGGRAGGADGSPDAEAPPPRKVMLPADWTPSPADWELARERGMSDKAIRAQADQFRDYWRSRGDRRVDWSGTWRNRIRDLTRKLDETADETAEAKPVTDDRPPGPGAEDPQWQAIAEAFRRLDRRGEGDFRSWLRPLGFQGIDGGTLRLTTDSRFAATKVRQTMADRLRDAALAAGIPIDDVEVAVAQPPPNAATAATASQAPSARAAA